MLLLMLPLRHAAFFAAIRYMPDIITLMPCADAHTLCLHVIPSRCERATLTALWLPLYAAARYAVIARALLRHYVSFSATPFSPYADAIRFATLPAFHAMPRRCLIALRL